MQFIDHEHLKYLKLGTSCSPLSEKRGGSYIALGDILRGAYTAWPDIARVRYCAGPILLGSDIARVRYCAIPILRDLYKSLLFITTGVFRFVCQSVYLVRPSVRPARPIWRN